MSPRLLCLLALAASIAFAPAGCRGDEEDESGGSTSASETTETEISPAAAARALEDTSVKPQIPRPSGAPPRRLETENIVRGKGRAAKRGDIVVVHHAGVTFSTGEDLASSWDAGRPLTFKLGGGKVIEGWDRGIVGMKTGGRRKLTIPPELAYGAAGSPPVIGPNETLVFVVDLLRVR
jgi:peptidylprolyl isomerase